MTDIFNAIIIFSWFIMVVYLIWMFKWSLSWNLYIGRKINLNSAKKVKISIVVAVRNEEENISVLIQNLLNQNYPSDLYEIIISDDFSTDSTVNKIQEVISGQFKKSAVVKFVPCNAFDTQGKKSALERAIKIASGELIITTDADCIASPGWVSSYADVYVNTGAKMITGMVIIDPCNNFITKLQALDFLSLSGTGAVSVISNKPLMCNGANLAFTKEAFYNIGGYSYGKDLPTGDDTFLMLKIAKSGRGSVVFNSLPESIIKTMPANSIGAFISQRIRWASKVKTYFENYIKLTGGFIFLVNLMLLILILVAITGFTSWNMIFALWLLKAVADFSVLSVFCIYAKQQKLLLVFLPAQLLYPVYSVIGGLISSVKSNYEWKGRKF